MTLAAYRAATLMERCRREREKIADRFSKLIARLERQRKSRIYCLVQTEGNWPHLHSYFADIARRRGADALTGAVETVRLGRCATSAKPFQVTADGFPAYPFAIESTLADRVDFAQLIKVYRATPEGERRYSPAEVVSTEAVPVIGNPDPKRICTSIVERQNLTMPMQSRRLTRLTNGFSKRLDHLWGRTVLALRLV